MIDFCFYFDKDSQNMVVLFPKEGKAKKVRNVHCVVSSITSWNSPAPVKVAMVGKCEKVIESGDTIILI